MQVNALHRQEERFKRLLNIVKVPVISLVQPTRLKIKELFDN